MATPRASKALKPAADEGHEVVAAAAKPVKRTRRAADPKSATESASPAKAAGIGRGKTSPGSKIQVLPKTTMLLHAQGTPDPAFASLTSDNTSSASQSPLIAYELESSAGEDPPPTGDDAQRPVVLIGIDPDATGALAVVQWGNSSALFDAQRLQHTVVDVHDMPMMRVEVGKRSRKCAHSPTIGSCDP